MSDSLYFDRNGELWITGHRVPRIFLLRMLKRYEAGIRDRGCQIHKDTNQAAHTNTMLGETRNKVVFWKYNIVCVGFEVLTAVTIFWGVKPCTLVQAYRWFGRMYCLHLQDRRVSQASNQQLSASCCCLCGLFSDPEDGGNIFLRNVDELLSHYTVWHPRR
jgi:hypothetical protein